MPYFYKNLFKVWSLFQIQKTESSYSLHWLLEEPLIFGARLDITNNCNLNGLSIALQKSRAVTLGQMLILAGSNLENAEMASQHLGIRSVRLVSLFLFKLRSALTDEENQMLKDYNSGTYTPNAQDLFPCLEILPNLDGCTGLVLKNWQSLWLDLLSTKGNLLYRACVMAFNKTYFERKVDTPWRSFFGLDENVKPEWRSLYKPPLSKRAGDLQWKILHGIIAVNSFISVLNPEVSSENVPFGFKGKQFFMLLCNVLDYNCYLLY